MKRPHDPCACCARFSTADHPTEAAGGMGRCTGYDNPGEPIKFVPHDGQPCVLFNATKHRAARERYVGQMQAKQQELEKA